MRANENSARNISSKLKKLRASLKSWSKNISDLSLLINNCDTTILFLDQQEDTRGLFNTEANLRIIIKAHLQTSLHYKNLYWRKRFTNNRIKFGDECTKFFHAMATISHRKNTITQLLNEDGVWVFDHTGKEGILWIAFKNRLGISTEINMLFNLDHLIQPRDNLEALSAPILKEEIDSVIKRMPTHKAPGPDGFNGLFMKKCWHIVKNDFYKLCEDFFEGQGSLEGINNSYITLIPKKHNPETINDYEPISLMNISPKLITKILADRLQSGIKSLMHKNQYGFIRIRTIQDCLAWCFEYIHQCHHSKRKAIILKLDFEKAFDLVEHQVILQMMTQLGLPDTWISWIERILNSGTTCCPPKWRARKALQMQKRC
jgi:hypothetical protein